MPRSATKKKRERIIWPKTSIVLRLGNPPLRSEAGGDSVLLSPVEQPIKDAVITVPAFFNQAERRAVLQAARMAGLKVLQLINDNTATALSYGVFRRKDINSTAQVSQGGTADRTCRVAESDGGGHLAHFASCFRGWPLTK